VIERTSEMDAAVKRRMGVPDGHEMDPWMGSAIEDVLAIVERDWNMQPRPDGSRLAPHCPVVGESCPGDANGVLCTVPCVRETWT